MFTRKWMALAAAGLLSLAIVPAISMAKPAAKHTVVAAHKPVVKKTVTKKPTAVTSHKKIAAKKPVAKKVVKRGNGHTVAKKHGKKTVKHTASHKPVTKATPKTVAHKTVAAKPTIATPPAMF